MPYKYTDPWHKAMRQFIDQASLGEYSQGRYREWLERVGRMMGFPAPKVITMSQLRELERTLPCGESGKAVQLSVTRAFLFYSGCQVAKDWKFPYRVRPKVNGIFLSEPDVMSIRKYAQALGSITELYYSLGVDNGLRVVDMQRLTMSNVCELTRHKCTTILGKGRGDGKPGHLELSKMTERPLAAYLQLRQDWLARSIRDSENLIVIPAKDCLRSAGYTHIAYRLKELSEASGVEFHAHDLRRTYGHRLHMAGIPIETIARLMRHETINQSFRSYIGIDSDELRRAQDKLNP